MIPSRGFEQVEFEQRLERVQREMSAHQLDAIVLTTEPHVRYFSGFFSQFWHSPTRPWYLVVPRSGKPIAIIPEIGVSGMQSTWVEDIRSWPAPRPEDDGLSMLANACEQLPKRHGRIGFTLGIQSTLRMPVNDYHAFLEKIRGTQIVDVALMMHQLLSVKSDAEIKKIQYACELASNAFIALKNQISTGLTQRQICQKLRLDIVRRGADDIPFMIAGSGAGGYDSIIMGPSDDVLNSGDILIIDTGCVFDGYFCDFDRNYGFGQIDDQACRAYETLYNATEAGLKAAVPGNTMADLFSAMWKVMDAGGASASDVGRMGHGLGMQLTEWPSITVDENTPLEPGMVLTLEPAMGYDKGKQMVHEENIVITEHGAQLLTLRAWPQLPIIKR